MIRKSATIRHIAVSIAALLLVGAQAQLGGLLKTTKPSTAAGSAPASHAAAAVDEDKIFAEFTPAAKLLAASSAAYARALDNKTLAAKIEAQLQELENGGKKATSNLAKSVGKNAKQLSADLKAHKGELTEEQKRHAKEGNEKLAEGAVALAAVATPTALAIKDLTDSGGPQALLTHPELAVVGAFCAKDTLTIMSFLKVANDFSKVHGITVSDAAKAKADKALSQQVSPAP